MDLPQHLFNYVSTITPLVSVELVIRCPRNKVLLSWRDDDLYGPGWHLPGGVVRYKESLIDRVSLVASIECSIDSFDSCTFLQVNQTINSSRDLRGHFISLIYGLTINYVPRISHSTLTNGSLALFSASPPNLIAQHLQYSDLINSFLSGDNENIEAAGNVCTAESN